MDKINHCINHNRFIPIDTEELSALELIGKGTEKTNELVDKSNNHEERITNNERKKVSFDDMKEKFKFDNNFSDIDYRGKWFGLDEPTLSDEGMRSQVQKNRDDIIKTNEQMDNIEIQLPLPSGIDDTLIIQSAINNVNNNNGGGVVSFNKGTYKFTTLEIKENVKLVSRYSTTLQKISSSENGIIISGNNSKIENLIIDLNNKATFGINILTGVNNVLLNCLSCSNVVNQGNVDVSSCIKINDNSSEIKIINCDIFNATNTFNGVARGIFMYTRDGQNTTKNVTIENNKIHDITPVQDADGIHLSGIKNQTNKNNIIISRNTFYNCSKRAIKIMCSHVLIKDNIIVSNYLNSDTEGMYSGISVYSSLVTIENNQIYNKTFKYGGIDVVGNEWEVRDLKIINNTIKVGQDGGQPPYQGAIQFDVILLENVLIKGNTIISSNMGIVFKRYSKNVKILNNSITSTNACIKTFNTSDFIKCDDFTISNNTIANESNYGIHLEKANANFIISSNTITSKFEPIETSLLTEPIVKNGNNGNKSINGIFAFRVTSLPTPSKLNEGQILLKYESGSTPWSLHICISIGGSYQWKQISYL